MAKINFSTFAQTFYKHMTKPNMSKVTRILLVIIIECSDVVDEKGKKYEINNKEYIEFYKGEAEVFGNIRKAANLESIKEQSPEMMDSILELNFSDVEQTKLYDDMIELVNQDNEMPTTKKDEIIDFYDNNEYTDFLSAIFLYSFNNPNNTNPKVMKTVTPKKLEDNDQTMVNMLKSMKRPVGIIIHDNLDEQELVYTQELLKVFAEDENVSIITKEDLQRNHA